MASKFLVAYAISLVRAGEVHEEHKNDIWGYAPSSACNGGENGKCGPAEWHTITEFKSCAEQGTQSPINMVLDETEAMPPEHGFEFLETAASCKDKVTFMLNEHTTEVEFAPDCEDAFHVKFMGEKYTLVQTHYHSPSENQWDGKYFPMEAHYVHKCAGCSSKGGDKYVVLAQMIGVSSFANNNPDKSRANTFLHHILQAIPAPNATSKDNKYTKEGKMTVGNPYDLLSPSFASSHYYFEGSMTTPACNPGPTHWIMSAKAVFIAQETLGLYRKLINSDPNNQLAPFAAIVGKSDGTAPEWNVLSDAPEWDTSLNSNNRPIQPLTGADNPTRKVYATTSTTPETDSPTFAWKGVDDVQNPGLALAAIFLAPWVLIPGMLACKEGSLTKLC